MKDMRKLFCPILLVIAAVILCVGCSENLTNEKAKKLILATAKYPIKKIAVIAVSPGPDHAILISKDEMPNYIKMMANKLITMNIHGIANNNSEYYEVKLTEEGKKYVLKEDVVDNKFVVEVLLGEAIFDKIISIRNDANGKGYNVKYLEEMRRITPFGTSLIDKAEYERTVRLVLSGGKLKIAENVTPQ